MGNSVANERLRETIRASGFGKVVDLAKAAVVKAGTISSYLNDRRNLTWASARKLGPPLGVSPDWLMDGKEPKKMEASIAPVQPPAGQIVEVDGDTLRFAIDELCRQFGESPERAAEITESIFQLGCERRAPPGGIPKEKYARRTVNWVLHAIRAPEDEQ